MPNLTPQLYKGVKGYGRNGRLEMPKFPFKELVPMSLRDFVSGKGDKQKGVACLQELALMLGCLKDNNYNEKTCGKEIEAFTKCSLEIRAEIKRMDELEAAGLSAPGVNRLTARQLNKLLKENRQPK